MVADSVAEDGRKEIPVATNVSAGNASQPLTPPTFGNEKADRSGLFWLNVVMAMRGLDANKMRSFLTMLGVIIGVAATIVAIAIGKGSKTAVEESIQKLGTNVLTVLPGSQKRGQISFGGGSSQTLKLADADAILKECPSVKNISPTFQRSAQIKYKNKNNNTPITGTGPDYPEISAHPGDGGQVFYCRGRTEYLPCGRARIECEERPLRRRFGFEQNHSYRGK